MDPFGLYTIDHDCCCNIGSDILNGYDILRKLMKMWNNWKPGENYKTYGLGTMATAAGFRSSALKKRSKCFNEAVEELETSWSQNVWSSWLMLVAATEMRPWPGHIEMEICRRWNFQEKLINIELQCKKKFARDGYPNDKWRKCYCKP